MFRNDDAPRLPIDARLVTSAPVPGVVVVHDERLKVLPSAGNSYDAAADHTADGGKLERVVNELSGLKSQLLGHLVMGMVNEGAAAGGGAAAGAAAAPVPSPFVGNVLAWQTEKVFELDVGRDGHTVYVRPELVVEVAFNDVQASPQDPGGLAPRFARVKLYRPDKGPDMADTIATVRHLHRRAGGEG